MPWIIELRTPQMANPIQVRVNSEIIIGRSVPQSSRQPDVDFSPYRAEQKGVSRQHCALYTRDQQLLVRDLGSNNGTLLNGEGLEANIGYPVYDGDLLQLGQLQIYINVTPVLETEQEKTSLVQVDDVAIVGKSERILIVEDDSGLAEVFKTLLERSGYRVKVCHEVLSAIRSFSRFRPDLVILDLMLPDLSGLEFCRYVRRDVTNNRVPVIVVTARRDVESLNEAQEAGADLFLKKPIKSDELREAVGVLLQQYTANNTERDSYTRKLVGTAPLEKLEPIKRHNAVVIYISGYSGDPVTIDLNQRKSFGRSTRTGDLSRHIDLGRFNASALGVSRVHMFMFMEDDTFYVEDNESTNGTRINGEKLTPKQPAPINNGDEVRLGDLRMYIYFLDRG